MKYLWMLILAGLLAAGATAAERPAKYVFYFIGDGMGFPHLTMAREAGRPEAATAALDALPVRGTALTDNVEGKTTDSAAAGTALACGFKTQNGRLARLPDGRPVDSIAKLAKMQGRQVAVITSDALNGATPAAFYAHEESRKNYDAIARWLPLCTFDYLAGGVYRAGDATRAEVDGALNKLGYTQVRDKTALAVLLPADLPVIAMQDWGDYEVDRAGRRDLPRLADYTAKAIELLRENADGFLIVVEGARIDHGAHRNDAVATIGEIREFNRAVLKALDFYGEFPDETVIVVTADHNTGAPQLGGPVSPELLRDRRSHRYYAEELRKHPEMVRDFDAMLNGLAAKDSSEADREELRQLKESSKEALPPLEKLAARAQSQRDRRFGIVWTTFGHSSAPVPVLAIGRGTECFGGVYENREIPRKLFRLMGIIAENN